MLGVSAVQKLVEDKSTGVPVIDFSELSDPNRRHEVCAQVARACESVGFFEMKNHGIPRKVLDEAFDVCRDFYNLSQEEKLTLGPEVKDKKKAIPVFQPGYRHAPVFQGVQTSTEEMIFRDYHLRKGKDEFYTNGDKPQEDLDRTLNWWPKNPTDYREKIERLLVELGKVGDTLLDVFSESLGLPRTYLRLEHHKNATVPRILDFHHYPKSTQTKVDETGVIPHRDSSVFTIVAQGHGTSGLWINPYGEWVPVCPQEGGLVVNVGDILQAWTNNRYRSILHRVIRNKTAGRHSLAYFIFPAPGPEKDYIVEPISKLISEKNPVAYLPFSYLDFFKNKTKVNSVSLLASHKAGS